MEPWGFAFATDIHVGSPRSFRFAPAWNENWQTAHRQIVGLRPHLLLLGGDLARDGNIHKWELEAVRDDLEALPFPYLVVPGNMDSGNKRTEVPGPRRDDVALNVTPELLANFKDVFGSLWWSFDHRGVRFSGFCDILAGSGRPEEAELWHWLDIQKKLPWAQHHVWVTHHPLFIERPDEPNWSITDPAHYLDWYFGIDEPQRSRIMEVFKATGADLVLSGHVHCRKTFDRDGIRFHIGPSTAFSQWGDRWPDGDPTLGFLYFEVNEGGIDEAFVPLEQVSAKEGYGPGGHPTPEQRDYSIAWEK